MHENKNGIFYQIQYIMLLTMLKTTLLLCWYVAFTEKACGFQVYIDFYEKVDDIVFSRNPLCICIVI